MTASLVPVATCRSALWQLRRELETAGLRLVGPGRPATAVAAWGGDDPFSAGLATLRRLPTCRVSPGPLRSPYDRLDAGFSSLRIEFDGEGPEAGRVFFFDAWSREETSEMEATRQVSWLTERFEARRPRATLLGVSGWKRRVFDRLFVGPDGPPLYESNPRKAAAAARQHGGGVTVWATRMPAALPGACLEAGVPLHRVEDGFLRSVGLGASFMPGASIVVDGCGIYYDGTGRNDLARLLATAEFPTDLVARATRLRERIVEARLSKYNVGLSPGADLLTSVSGSGRRVVLVPGQAEDDASVRQGSPVVRSNLSLLKAVRLRHPDAFILFKPHPDVEAGFRPGRIETADVDRWADRVVAGLSIANLLERVDHVETMTSLAGFEALLRGRTVTSHGKPFYSGWGLTEDLAPDAGRGRRLQLDEMVAAAFLLYSRYIDPVTLKPCPPERLLDRLVAARDASPRTRLGLSSLGWLSVRLRYILLNPWLRLIRSRRGVSPDRAPPAINDA